jgi:hypothetical protein
MTDRSDVERALDRYLAEGATVVPDWVLDDALHQIEDTPQRRAPRVPWRFPEMPTFLKPALVGAAIVAVLIVGGAIVAGGPSNLGGSGVDATPTPDVSVAEPTPEPSDPWPTPPPLTQSFTSTQHGISLSYPEGWTAQAATEPWTARTFSLAFGEPHADWLSDPTLTHTLFLTIASQPITDPTLGDPIDAILEEWVAEQMASDEGCTVTEPIAVDRAPGLIGADGCNVAVVATANVTLGEFSEGTAGRGYWLQLYTGVGAPATYDSAWFAEILATVQLHPEEAAD